MCNNTLGESYYRHDEFLNEISIWKFPNDLLYRTVPTPMGARRFPPHVANIAEIHLIAPPLKVRRN